MSYEIKEMHYTIQGEGFHSGKPAVFVRFSKCNFWNGREDGRNSAICKFCDTDFIGTDGENGGLFESATDVAVSAIRLWGAKTNHGPPMVVFTGGEPLIQLDEDIVAAFKSLGFYIAVETNGSIKPPPGIDWICCSPKTRKIFIELGDELKLVYPQDSVSPSMFESCNFAHFFIQPMDGPALKENISKSVQFVKEHPQWRLSMQIHKLAGIP